jgi:hypothetical protein
MLPQPNPEQPTPEMLQKAITPTPLEFVAENCCVVPAFMVVIGVGTAVTARLPAAKVVVTTIRAIKIPGISFLAMLVIGGHHNP